MKVTAKVLCVGKYISGSGDSRQVKIDFVPDYNDGRNKEWARYTPSLQLSMTVRGEVADQFELDGAYLLTFTPDVQEPEPLPQAAPTN